MFQNETFTGKILYNMVTPLFIDEFQCGFWDVLPNVMTCHTVLPRLDGKWNHAENHCRLLNCV